MKIKKESRHSGQRFLLIRTKARSALNALEGDPKGEQSE